jgi:integrase
MSDRESKKARVGDDIEAGRAVSAGAGGGGKRGLTLRTVQALKPGAIAWDGAVKGFGARCQREGKFYVLKARVGGRQRWFTIGRHGSPWTPEKARAEAKRILGEVAAGKDPASERDRKKLEGTVDALAAAFLKEHVEAKRKPRTIQTYRDLLRLHALPRIGGRLVNHVQRADIARLHHSMKDTPVTANRVLAVLKTLFAWAEKHGYRAEGANPCRHVERYREHRRERFLSEAELARLAAVLAEAEKDGTESPYTLAAIRLLIFTGGRLREILNLRWEHVDLQRALLLLPDSKTGQKAIYLNAPALDVLAKLPRLAGNPHVIVGEREGAALVNLEKPWRRIRAKAGLDGVRLHDLRHSFASVAASGGMSLPMIGKLLGHTQAATTERYAHLAADPVRAANEAIGARLAAVMKGEAKAEVVELPKRAG